MKISTLIPVIREMHTSYLALITSRREIIAGALKWWRCVCLCYRGCDERDNQNSTLNSTKYAIYLRVPLFKWLSSHNPRKFWQTTLEWERWTFCHLFNDPTRWRERRVTCQELIDEVKHTSKKYHNFTWAIKGFLRDGNLCKTQ